MPINTPGYFAVTPVPAEGTRTENHCIVPRSWREGATRGGRAQRSLQRSDARADVVVPVPLVGVCCAMGNTVLAGVRWWSLHIRPTLWLTLLSLCIFHRSAILRWAKVTVPASACPCLLGWSTCARTGAWEVACVHLFLARSFEGATCCLRRVDSHDDGPLPSGSPSHSGGCPSVVQVSPAPDSPPHSPRLQHAGGTAINVVIQHGAEGKIECV